MTPDEYLQALRKYLKGFSREDQAALIEEIGSHIESEEEDPKMGKDSEQRRQKLMSELGAPGQLGKAFKRIYQPGRLIDFLLIVIPFEFINLLLSSVKPIYRLEPKYPWWTDARVIILFSLLIGVIGLWRHSNLLTLFWLPRTAVLIFRLVILNGVYYYGLVQTVALLLLLGVVLYLFGRLAWQARDDFLMVIYGLLPLISGVLGTTLMYIQKSQLTFQMSLYDYYVYKIFYLIPPLDLYLVSFVMLALFFFGNHRDIRWAALATIGVLFGFAMSTPNFFSWIVVPLAIVFFGWLLDGSKRKLLRLVA